MSLHKTCLLALGLALCVNTAIAGTLATVPGVYVDGYGPWQGSTHFTGPYVSPGVRLEGDIDWAVWAPGTFPYLADSTVPADQFVYSYQVLVGGQLNLSSYSLNLINEAYNIGTFTDGNPFGPFAGKSPTDINLIPFDSATWSFEEQLLNDHSIPPGGVSVGLLFTSPNLPMLDQGSTIDGGTVALVIPVPTPSNMNVPEPATLTLALCGLFGFAFQIVRSRRANKG